MEVLFGFLQPEVAKYEQQELTIPPSPDCKAWTYRAETSECRILASEDRTCHISYFPSGQWPVKYTIKR